MKQVVSAKLVDERDKIYEVLFRDPLSTPDGLTIKRRMTQDEMTNANKQTSLLLRLKGIIPEAQYESVIREIADCLDSEGEVCFTHGINQAIEAHNG